SHLEAHTHPLDSVLDEEWKWPFSKFGYKTANVLFTNLHLEFNCIKITIQDPCTWYNNVCGVARSAENKEEFLVQLKQ
ncbi:hypothetical protein QBC33DRAFT_462882, partial [Phialemonium atrogriseum]